MDSIDGLLCYILLVVEMVRNWYVSWELVYIIILVIVKTIYNIFVAYYYCCLLYGQIIYCCKLLFSLFDILIAMVYVSNYVLIHSCYCIIFELGFWIKSDCATC